MGAYLSRFTFYDVMGYLLPGLLSLCAVFLGGTAVNPTWAVPAVSNVGGWFVVIVAAYFTGHGVQGLTHRLLPRSVLRDQVAKVAPVALQTVVAKAIEHYGIKADDNPARFAALDALKIEFDDRDVFIARQGFFRGSSLSFGLLGVVLLTACLFGRAVSVFAFCPDRALCGVSGGLCVGLAVLFFFRYRDFLRHELEHAAAAGAKGHTSPKTASRPES